MAHLTNCTENEMNFVDHLPLELVEKLFSYLSVEDLMHVSRVSVSWHEASNSNRLWRTVIKKSIYKNRIGVLDNSAVYSGIASNFDEKNCFKLDSPTSSRLSPINPWKLSLLQINFVEKNWRKIAKHEFLEFLEMDLMEVVFPSKLPQDCLYYPVVAKAMFKGTIEKAFYLIRLDGTPKIVAKLFTPKDVVPIACVDRECVVWIHNGQVQYLVLSSDNLADPLIMDLGDITDLLNPSFFEATESGFDRELISSGFEAHAYLLTMDSDHIVARYQCHPVKIWCKKTFVLKFTYPAPGNDPKYCTINFKLYNGRLFLSVWPISENESHAIIYDIKENKLIRKFYVQVEQVICNDKYYVIISHDSFSVYEMDSNKIMIDSTGYLSNNFRSKVWIVDENVLYFDENKLKRLSLIDWKVSVGELDWYREFLGFAIDSSISYTIDISNRRLILINEKCVGIWDWKRETKLSQISSALRLIFNNNETWLVASNSNSVTVVGFW